mmetsp:Transcript_7814/g.21910  ORF Transcript_7814/g.21910 Transcript_7814/m.21910 type:complete len:324 (+) Transcript_7814:1556-2527(+)
MYAKTRSIGGRTSLSIMSLPLASSLCNSLFLPSASGISPSSVSARFTTSNAASVIWPPSPRSAASVILSSSRFTTSWLSPPAPRVASVTSRGLLRNSSFWDGCCPSSSSLLTFRHTSPTAGLTSNVPSAFTETILPSQPSLLSRAFTETRAPSSKTRSFGYPISFIFWSISFTVGVSRIVFSSLSASAFACDRSQAQRVALISRFVPPSDVAISCKMSIFFWCAVFVGWLQSFSMSCSFLLMNLSSFSCSFFSRSVPLAFSACFFRPASIWATWSRASQISASRRLCGSDTGSFQNVSSAQNCERNRSHGSSEPSDALNSCLK